MVWSQYVYEAQNGYDAGFSDDDEHDIDTPLSIEDWEVEYSDELGHMWNTMRTLMYDAQLHHIGEFHHFVEFCYKEHDTYYEQVVWDSEEQAEWYEGRLLHIWRSIRRIINDNHLHEDMMRGVTFYHFVDFAKNYMGVY